MNEHVTRDDTLELLLVRHGETTASRSARYLGWGDAPLTAEGEASARQLGARLPSADLVVSSDLPRALATARLALPRAILHIEPRLRELHFGAFEGGTYDENVERHGGRFLDWCADPRRHRPPGGELVGELEARVRRWLSGLPARGRAVAFLHGGSMRAAMALVEGRRTEELLPMRIEPGESVTLTVGAWKGAR